MAETRSFANPVQGLPRVPWAQLALFMASWIAWMCDALDFYTVILSVRRLAKELDRSTSEITTGITLTLLLRSLGAAVFGVLSDRFGRKWPIVANLLMAAALELGMGFITTYAQFLVLRSLFGIAMGGMWGMASSAALENLPVELRGLASGLFQESYAVGNIFAACINLMLVPGNRYSWRALFWTAGGISFFAAALRAVLPESVIFLRAKSSQTPASSKTRVFLRETKLMLKHHWKLSVYGLLLMSGWAFLTHGTQDLFPTYLQVLKGFSEHQSTVATIMSNCGAIAGGTIGGAISQRIGRRFMMRQARQSNSQDTQRLTLKSIALIVTGAFIPLWILPRSFSALVAGGFFIQFGVHGAFGVIPIYLAEISPPAFRATFPGVVHSLGVMVAAASAQIEATAGEHVRMTIRGAYVPDYGKVEGIFVGIAAAFTLVLTVLGPEQRGRHFENHRLAFEAAVVKGGGAPELSSTRHDPDAAEKSEVSAA
ncbi:MFS general substrate transporter [Auricularia subglabra TFB-10046 SS5]|nr:MFS general substrate transporter [Auricularia subglabra TFB-10046 SS5]